VRLLRATAGRIGCALKGKKTIQYEIHGTKSREAALDKREPNHCREHEPLGTHVVSQRNSAVITTPTMAS
jgi:hypothetical protein